MYPAPGRPSPAAGRSGRWGARPLPVPHRQVRPARGARCPSRPSLCPLWSSARRPGPSGRRASSRRPSRPSRSFWCLRRGPSRGRVRDVAVTLAIGAPPGPPSVPPRHPTPVGLRHGAAATRSSATATSGSLSFFHCDQARSDRPRPRSGPRPRRRTRPAPSGPRARRCRDGDRLVGRHGGLFGGQGVGQDAGQAARFIDGPAGIRVPFDQGSRSRRSSADNPGSFKAKRSGGRRGLRRS